MFRLLHWPWLCSFSFHISLHAGFVAAFSPVNQACCLFPSQSQALAHYKGTKHAKKLKALDAPKSKLKGSVVTKETANQEMAKGINTSQVPNSTERKGSSFPACRISPRSRLLLFPLCGCSLLLGRTIQPPSPAIRLFWFAALNS